MGSINANMIVEVHPRAVRGGSQTLSFSCLLLTKSNEARLVDKYYSADGVGSVFGFTSEEFKFAQAYFSADENKTRTPQELLISNIYAENTAAWLASAPIELEEVKGISNGAFDISIDGQTINVTSLNLSECSTMSEVAEAISTKVTSKGTCTYNGAMKRLIIKSNTSGVKSTISFALGQDADKLKLSLKSGAEISLGVDQKSPEKALRDITADTMNFVTYTTAYEATAEEAIELSKLASEDVAFIYMPWTKDGNAFASGTADLASKLEEAGASHVFPVYGTPAYVGFFAGMVASTDWNAVGGVKDYAFKTSSILPPNVSNTETANILTRKKYNFIGNFATRAAQFQLSAFGTLLGQTYRYLDELTGMIWLADAIQVACMDGFKAVNRTAYVDEDYVKVRSWISTAVAQGLTNRYIQAGVTLSESQKTLLISEIGKDVSRDIFSLGYYLSVRDPGAKARSNRESPRILMYFTYGGSIHKLDIPVTALF